MRPSSTTFQPYDRVTGTELSQTQQEDCQVYYLVIKTYIDAVESKIKSPLPWTRKKLRYSTAELLDAIERLADDIRKKQRRSIVDTDGTTSVQLWAEAEGDRIAAPELGSDDVASHERYQTAVNLLHELVSRFADVDESSMSYLSAEMRGGSPYSRGSLTLVHSSLSSGASTAVSNVPASRTSVSFATTPKTGGSETSNDAAQPGTHESEEASFEIDPFDERIDEPLSAYDQRKERATYDWVLEYLRGGWQSNSPATAGEPTISPIAPFSTNTSPAESFRPLQRTASDNISTYSEDGAPQPFRGSSAPRAARRGRPIPAMASRLKRKVRDESVASALDHFKTPRSIFSGNTVFCTPESGANSHLAAKTSDTSAWNKYLRQKGLIPNPFEEMDWSGRGQHAEFEATEELEIPLLLEKGLGSSANALVESVRCRRIRLARKTVQVSRRLKKEEAMKEVEHLQRLKHSHIIRVVGTYTLPRALSILLYPVADYTLDVFLEMIEDDLSVEETATRLYSVSTFFRCLSKAVAYIHENAIKHMDIKPKNLLVRDMHNSIICNQGKYKIYIADFGIARAYRSIDDCNTESPTAYTKTYAAPEVIAQERRDQKADIFSLGAVFAEMLAVLATELDPNISNLDILHSIRESDQTDRSYAAHALKIQAWLRHLSLTSYGFESDTYHSHITELVASMLSTDPADRHTAAMIVENIPFRAFCCDVNGGSEPFEAADRKLGRQLYDRAMEIAEADERYFRCMVEGCVKVYSSRERLEYHVTNGHGESTEAVPEPPDSKDLPESEVDEEGQSEVASHGQRDAWSTF